MISEGEQTALQSGGKSSCTDNHRISAPILEVGTAKPDPPSPGVAMLWSFDFSFLVVARLATHKIDFEARAYL